MARIIVVTDSFVSRNTRKSVPRVNRSTVDLRRIGLGLEAVGVFAGLLLSRVLPLDLASSTGAALFRCIGPFLREHKIAERNVRHALPAVTDDEVRSILRGMWDNLGRVATEYAHLGTLAWDEERVEIVDDENLLESIRKEGKGGILVTAHFGNWELASVASLRAGIVQNTIYRAQNNPSVDRTIRGLRRSTALGESIPKGRHAISNVVAILRREGYIGMLADQKHNEGEPIPFFGRDAKTTTAPAKLARRFGLPIMLGKVERTRGARFRVTVSRLELSTAVDANEEIIQTTRRLNATFENWIRERPDLWLWAHRRWPN